MAGRNVLDWVIGWEKTGKGRIFRVHDPLVDVSPLVLETKKPPRRWHWGKRGDDDLVKLLNHADQRVRYAAQFELVKRGDASVFAQASHEKSPRLTRLHAMWGLAQMARSKPKAAGVLGSFAHDKDTEVRGQWQVCRETGRKSDADAVIRLLADDEPRVRFFAAQALGKLGLKEAVPALIAMRNLGNDFRPVRPPRGRRFAGRAFRRGGTRRRRK